MTHPEEVAFRKHFELEPFDYFALESFADWLQDRDDPRAEGYRFMGRYRRGPYKAVIGQRPDVHRWVWGQQEETRPALRGIYRSTMLPGVLFRFSPLSDISRASSDWMTDRTFANGSWWYFLTAWEARDAAALAWAAMSDADRRAGERALVTDAELELKGLVPEGAP